MSLGPEGTAHVRIPTFEPILENRRESLYNTQWEDALAGNAMKQVRKVKKTLNSKPTIEGAGVRLKRAFGFQNVPEFDPFLLLDDFHSSNPDDYMAGFPWHPHRGIETITYVLNGEVEHRDSMGHSGVIRSGEVQWMTAGSGIIHQEMPRLSEPEIQGFQLWANLPASHKMMSPRYREIQTTDIPEIVPAEGITIKVICGKVAGTIGPVKEILTDPEYLDVTMQEHAHFRHPAKEGHNVFAYVLEGRGVFQPGDTTLVGNERVVLFDDGDGIEVQSSEVPLRFLLISGRPLREPVAWYGPIVMNSQEELRVAFEEYQSGTFIKHGSSQGRV